MSNPSPEAIAAAKAIYPKTAAAMADVEAAEAQGMTCAFSAARYGILKAATIIDEQFAAIRKNSDRLRWLHTGGGSGARKEWGVAEIEFDANGQVIGAFWGLSDSSDIDKAMKAEFADENPALAMNRPETHGLPETH